MILLKKNISYFILIVGWLSSFIVRADQVDLHFWPTNITLADPQSTGMLYSWPEYNVILQTKNESNYSPARIDKSLAEQLSKYFTNDDASLIEIHHDEAAMTWGLTIPGGPILRAENARILPLMEEKFTDCLKTLDENQVDLIREVFYSPTSFVGGTGINLSPQHRAAVSQMLRNFKANRCSNGETALPQLLRQRTHEILKLLLTGESNTFDKLPGPLWVLTTMLHDILFTSEGLWVRVTLALIKDFVEKHLEKAPRLLNAAIFEKDYRSFIDFILTTKTSQPITVHQYLAIAKAFHVVSLMDAFKPFLARENWMGGKFVMVNMQIGMRTSSLFFNGEKT